MLVAVLCVQSVPPTQRVHVENQLVTQDTASGHALQRQIVEAEGVL